MSGLIGKLLNRPSSRDRRYQRIASERPAQLFFTDRQFSVPGMIMELSRGGALFREASDYILDRRRASVALRVGGHELRGVIVNVRPAGYGIRFDEPVSEDVVSELSQSLAPEQQF